ncbi:MAG: nucleoside deaminase [Eubacteriales bacterium]|nr:nucleoside deaminase [Eubacteriales bacterium]
MEHEGFMQMALQEAQKAYALGEVPIGAVVVQNGQVIARAHNLSHSTNNPLAHAEHLAIQAALQATGQKYLSDCTLYVTLEPCPMCAGVLLMARLKECYFAAADARQGCVESQYNLLDDTCFYHRVKSCGGIARQEAEQLLQTFFKEKRK